MIIIRTSKFSGKTRAFDLPVTEEQISRISSGEKIQDVLPHLTDFQREFIMTGITQEEWNQYFASDKEDEEEF